MNLASSLVFHRTQSINQHTVHPYLHSFSHHRNIENMTRSVSFPDVVPPKDIDLHFESGDFLKLFPEKETHDAVVTLFFIDTVSADLLVSLNKSLTRPTGLQSLRLSRDDLASAEAGRRLDQRGTAVVLR